MYLDRVRAGPVSGAHIAVALRDGAADAQVAVLAVHVVDSRAGLVAQPDAEVLDLDGALLWDFLEFIMVLVNTLHIPKTIGSIKQSYCTMCNIFLMKQNFNKKIFGNSGFT